MGGAMTSDDVDRLGAAHQPGPWWVTNLGHTPWTDALAIGYGPNRLGDYDESGFIAYTTRGFEDGPSWANAHMLAAAPELFDALKAFVDAGDGHDDFTDLWPQARAALAKARGKVAP